MVAAGNKAVGFIILLAGTGIPGDQLLLMQQELVGRANRMSDEDLATTRRLNAEAFELIKKISDPVVLKDSLQVFLKKIMKENPTMDRPQGITDDQLLAQQMETLLNPWVLYFLRYDPFPALTKVKCPVLALNGEKDLQVPPKENLAAIEAALKKAKNRHVTIKEFPGLNHLFQQCTTGSPDEYAGIEQTISPEVLKMISDWILAR
jgi:pimeloyl-ACP methyl ester carboxylesterase